MKSKLFAAVAAGVVAIGFGLASPALASTIDLKFTGVGSGAFGGVAFSNTAFEIDGTADTTAIAPFPGQPGVTFLPLSSASMSLTGLVIHGTVSPGLQIFEAPGIDGLGELTGGVPFVNLISGMPGWDGISNLGPVTFTPFNFNQFSFDFRLNGSALTFSSMGPVTFTATLEGGAVPEPASWALMIGGFGMAGAALRRRQNAMRAA